MNELWLMEYEGYEDRADFFIKIKNTDMVFYENYLVYIDMTNFITILTEDAIKFTYIGEF